MRVPLRRVRIRAAFFTLILIADLPMWHTIEEGMSEQATVATDPAAREKRRARGAQERHRPVPMRNRMIAAFSRLSLRSSFWILFVGAIVLSELLTLGASFLVFRAARLELLLIALAVAALTAGILCFTVMLVLGHLRAQQLSLERFATVDELTGSPNRRVFLARLESEVDRCTRLGTRLSIVFVDVDHFKRINDDYGHQLGDAVLKGIFARLEESLRAYDFVGRYGGDEFVMALPGNDAEGGAAVAERLRQSVQESGAGKVSPPVTISLGVAQLERGMNAEGLLKSADMALYRAKNAGRNRTVMFPPQS
jgi:diguanylate cyclase (GGDEF)-like protein